MRRKWGREDQKGKIVFTLMRIVEEEQAEKISPTGHTVSKYPPGDQEGCPKRGRSKESTTLKK